MNPPKVLNVISRSLDMVRSVEMRIGLCKGRHDIVDNGVTVTDFVFEEAVNHRMISKGCMNRLTIFQINGS